MTGWKLPVLAVIGGKNYRIHTDYREILEIFTYLQDEALPEFVRWRIALALFYEEDIPEEDIPAAAEYFCRFINCGREESREPGSRLLDWEQDAQEIIADINKVAGQEIRSLPHLHWWTFMGWFLGIGEGNLSMLVSIRDKLSRGKPLESGEKEYCRRNRERVILKKKYSEAELAEQKRLQAILGQENT